MLRILIADDEPLARQRLHALLADEADVEVVGDAMDGVEAADRIRELDPDLILLDINMPVVDGVALARTLAVRGRPGVVFVSALDDNFAWALDVDAVDLILKPVSVERLRGALARARRRLKT